MGKKTPDLFFRSGIRIWIILCYKKLRIRDRYLPRTEADSVAGYRVISDNPFLTVKCVGKSGSVQMPVYDGPYAGIALQDIRKYGFRIALQQRRIMHHHNDRPSVPDPVLTAQ